MPTTSKSKSKGGGEDMFPKKPADVLKLIKDNNIEFIDLRFLDFIGTWQHFSVPASPASATSPAKPSEPAHAVAPAAPIGNAGLAR